MWTEEFARKGLFFEHDDRTASDELRNIMLKIEEKRKKKWIKRRGIWPHDLYNEDEQAPLSKEEIVAIYGYDIRSKERSPLAGRYYGSFVHNEATLNWREDVVPYACSQGASGGNEDRNELVKVVIKRENFQEGLEVDGKKKEDEKYASETEVTVPDVVKEEQTSSSPGHEPLNYEDSSIGNVGRERVMLWFRRHSCILGMQDGDGLKQEHCWDSDHQVCSSSQRRWTRFEANYSPITQD